MQRILPAFNPIALRKAKIVQNFGLSECNRVNSISAILDLIGFKGYVGEIIQVL